MDVMTNEEKNRIIACVEENNTQELRQFTNSSTLLTVRDGNGNSLLQIAILHHNREVFDYLLSINYPLELINNKGYAALYTALADYADNNELTSTHFIVELIKKGADVDEQDKYGRTPLHFIIDAAGDCDVNVSDCAEIVAMLLTYGANAFIEDLDDRTPFDASVDLNCMEVKELLFLYTFDQFTEYRMDSRLLLILAEKNPSWFLQIYKNIVGVDLKIILSTYNLLTIGKECLAVLIENFTEVLRCTFLADLELTFSEDSIHQLINNFYFVSNTKLQQDLIHYLSNAKIDIMTYFFLNSKLLPEMTELFCFLLSYGLHITEHDLQGIHLRFGYCELFKIMLHMDIGKPIQFDRFRLGAYAFPRLCYNLNIDLQTLCRQCLDVEKLLDYYNDPFVKKYCLMSINEEKCNKVKSMPRIPLLIELARNSFRKYFVEKFEITTPRRFYTLLKALPISPVHEKIITLETRLYY